MDKVDFKKTLKEFYNPKSRGFELVDVPDMQFVRVDGRGDPNTSPDWERAMGWVYSIAYTLKFASKGTLGRDYVVPPSEALWWADDMKSFIDGKKADWRWTLQLMVPDFVTPQMFDEAVAVSGRKLGAAPESLRFEREREGLSVQFLHIGSYDDEAPMIRRMHEEFIPANGLMETGHHHEIYLGDPRKAEPSKLKTIVRQPVRRR